MNFNKLSTQYCLTIRLLAKCTFLEKMKFRGNLKWCSYFIIESDLNTKRNIFSEFVQ